MLITQINFNFSSVESLENNLFNFLSHCYSRNCQFFLKNFDRVIKSRTLFYLNKCNFLSSGQFRFGVSLSTEDALISFVSGIYNGLDQRHSCAGFL